MSKSEKIHVMKTTLSPLLWLKLTQLSCSNGGFLGGNLGFQSFIDKMLAAENEGQVWMMLVRLLSDQIQDESFGLNSAMEAMDQIYGHNAGNLNVLEWLRTDNFKLFYSINYVPYLPVLYEYIT